MSIETVSDVLTRIGAIQQQIQELRSGSLPGSAPGASGGAALTSGSSGAGAFATQLAQAQQSSVAATGTGSSFGSLADSALGSAGTSGTSGTLGLGATGVGGTPLGTTGVGGPALGTTAVGVGVGGTPPGAFGVGDSPYGAIAAGGAGVSAAGLPASAATLLTSGQQQFAATLSADTGLNPAVVTSWLLAEESGGAAQTRQAANNNDWLNIGYTDSATYGASDSVWSDPTSAANATAAWLKGQQSIPGYGTASTGIQSILTTVGQAPAAQIQALQGSGWASGGYPSLPQLYSQVSGS